MARTTLILQDKRLRQLKLLAVERQQTLSSLVDEFLQQGLEKAHSVQTRKPRPLPRGKDMGRLLVDISDRDQLYDVLDGREISRRH
jgi:hypothetical protein